MGSADGPPAVVPARRRLPPASLAALNLPTSTRKPDSAPPSERRSRTACAGNICPEMRHRFFQKWDTFGAIPPIMPVRYRSHLVRYRSQPVRSQSHLVRSRPKSIKWTRHPVKSRFQPVKRRSKRLGMSSYGLETASYGVGKGPYEPVPRPCRVSLPPYELPLASYGVGVPSYGGADPATVTSQTLFPRNRA